MSVIACCAYDMTRVPDQDTKKYDWGGVINRAASPAASLSPRHWFSQGGYFHIRLSGGGLGPHIKFGGKIWGKVQPNSPNERKNLGGSVTIRHKSWGKIPILGSYLKFRGQNLGYLLPIFLEAEFGDPKEFQRQILGPSPPPTS